MKTTYQWTDPWLLLSIILASKNEGGTLRNIIAYGDVINHAVFRIEEVESGLYRLSQGGWINKAEEKFEPSQKALDEYEKVVNKRMSLLAIKDFFGSLMGATKWQENQPVPDSANKFNYPGFTKQKFEDACREYITTKRPG